MRADKMKLSCDDAGRLWLPQHRCYMREFEAGDVEAFAADMRVRDQIELKRWTGNTPEYELGRAEALSEVLWVGCWEDGTRLSMFGGKRLNMLERVGCIWELSTNAVEQHRLSFAKASLVGLRMVCHGLSDMMNLMNFVDDEYDQAKNWIRWLGGELNHKVCYKGRCGGTFKEFYIVNPYYKEY